MNWSYLAGLVDGEGSIMFSENRVSLQISNTHIGVLEECAKFVKCGSILKYDRRPNIWKPSGTFKITRHEDVLRVLRNIKPILIIKKDKAIIAIKYIEKKKWRNEVTVKLNKEKIKKLRNKGISYRNIASTMRCSEWTIRKICLNISKN